MRIVHDAEYMLHLRREGGSAFAAAKKKRQHKAGVSY